MAPKTSKRTGSEVLSDLMLRAATGRSFRTQQEAASFYGVSPSRFSEWSKHWEKSGAIPARRRVGHAQMFANA